MAAGVVGGSEDFARPVVFVVHCYRAPPQARGRLEPPDEEICKSSDFLSNEIVRGPIGPGRADRALDLLPQLNGDMVVILAGRRYTGGECQVEALIVRGGPWC